MKLIGGIDAGKTGMREVYLEIGWKHVKVAEYSKSAKIIASVPSQLLTFRHYSLPFTDRKRIREIIKEELSENLAFPLNESRWDFCVSSKGEIFATIARSPMLQELQKNIPKPFEMLDAEPYALVRTALFNDIKDALIIDFGLSKTVFCGCRDGAIDFIKVVLKGGEYLTKALSDEQKSDPAEMETLKCTRGLGHPTVKSALLQILRTAGIPSPFPYPRILITGGGAQLPGLQTFLEESFKTQVSTFTLPEGLSPYVQTVAFGMALRERDHETGINLAEEKKTPVGTVKYWIAASILPIILFSISLMLAQSNLAAQVRNYGKEMEKILLTDFPGIKKVQSAQLQYREKLDERKALLQNKGTNVIGLLDSISAVITGKDIHIYEIAIDDKTVTLTGETASYQEIEYMRKKLSESYTKVELQEGKTLPSKRITFTMVFTFEGGPESNAGSE